MRGLTASNDNDVQAIWSINGSDAPNNFAMTPLPSPPLTLLSLPKSPSPTLPMTATSPTAIHLPLYEWGNMAMGLFLSADPAVTCCLPTILTPAHYDLQHLLQHHGPYDD
ncbi:hypothetical protein EDD18DRAFT_1351976 [Armillaria luteobubalina]|uniref:Uncharacterized protein n=1 Tax=Armillaria luteobubalina TaxID=153913 RepID=A0AA39UTV2_9AGAR|nr:hypothetical protein EDD18DRAFT_1351976 [Armillaria luteobubalina]